MKKTKEEIPTKEEYTKILKEYLFEILKREDTKENVKQYIDGINFDEEYDLFNKRIYKTSPTIISALSKSGNYYYMMYPDY